VLMQVIWMSFLLDSVGLIPLSRNTSLQTLLLSCRYPLHALLSFPVLSILLLDQRIIASCCLQGIGMTNVR
jgi:hypothetical protein